MLLLQEVAHAGRGLFVLVTGILPLSFEASGWMPPGLRTVRAEFTEMIPEKRPLTYGDYCSWEDERRWELIDGQPYAMSSPSSLHQLISTALSAKLFQFLSGATCRVLSAPMDVKLSDYDVVQPDLLVVCDPTQIRPSYIAGPPKLVIEISSPTTQRHDRVRKLALYGKFGVPEYWLITPHPFMVEVLRHRDGLYTTVQVCTEHDILRSPAFPELNLHLQEIFDGLPPQPELDEVREGVPPYVTPFVN